MGKCRVQMRGVKSGANGVQPRLESRSVQGKIGKWGVRCKGAWGQG